MKAAAVILAAVLGVGGMAAAALAEAPLMAVVQAEDGHCVSVCPAMPTRVEFALPGLDLAAAIGDVTLPGLTHAFVRPLEP